MATAVSTERSASGSRIQTAANVAARRLRKASATTPRTVATNSGTFGLYTARTSPRPNPRAASPAAMRRAATTSSP